MNVGMIILVLKEYGLQWAVSRGFYSIKLKVLSIIPETERIFERRAGYPTKLDIFSPNIPAIQTFLRKLPKGKKRSLIELADNACVGRIWGFNSIELDYGCPINWQLNPATGKECDVTVKWYRIPDFDPERGDIKVTWEASRFSHFITLARAYMLTGNEKYYKAFSSQLADWIKKNPYSYGANFKCGQECSLRMINGLLAYTAFKELGLTTDIDRKNVEALILRCYRKICSNFFYAYNCVKNNHTISELVGMIVGAWCCGEKKRMAYAFQTLEKVVDVQFTDDGGYTQHSFNYERFALMDMEVIFSIEGKTGHKLSEARRKKLLAAVKLMYQCQDESGDMPNYGANDGALAFPVTSCGYRDFRPVINTVAALVSGKRLYKAGDYDEELLWFGNGLDYPMVHMERVSRPFDNAGLFTIRRQDSWVMLVCNHYKSRPAHMDQLHFDLWVDGVNVLCDCGTYSYAFSEGNVLIGNAAHNTIMVDGAPQMNVYGHFIVYGWTERGRIKHTNRLFYGEYKSKNGYCHQRTVEATDVGYKITDAVRHGGQMVGAYKVFFHTPCEVTENDGTFELRAGKKLLCRMNHSKAKQNHVKASKGNAIRSLYYLKKEDITCIEFEANTDKVVTEIEVIRQEGQ